MLITMSRNEKQQTIQLLDKLQQSSITKEEARELQLLLEKRFNIAIQQKKSQKLITSLSALLIGLNGYIQSSYSNLKDYMNPICYK